MTRPAALTTDLVERTPSTEPYVAFVWPGGGIVRALPKSGVLTIGRGEGVDVAIDHPSVSRGHATLFVDEPFRIIDHGSANGTWVGGQRLPPEHAQVLASNAVFEIGKVLVALHGEVPAPGGPSVPIWTDPLTLRVQRLASAIAKTSLPILVAGEPGVGKRTLARFIHEQSRRAPGPLVFVGCGEREVERRLLGYEKAAFAWAARAQPGAIEESQRGTIVLEGVADLPIQAQDTLVSVIDRRQLTRVGGTASRSVDARYVFTVDVDLNELVRRGRFRQELLRAMQGMSFVLPPLARRTSDIVPLAMSFLARAAQDAGKATPSLSGGAQERLLEHAWPGNLPELRSAMVRLCACVETAECTGVDVARAIGAPREDLAEASPEASEQGRILAALARCQQNQTRAAALLGMTRRALVYRIEALGLPRPRKRGTER